MDDFTIARVIHVLSVLIWIGGVAFVTTVVMPSIGHQSAAKDRLVAFHRIEGRFAPQARIWVLLAGASGFWMTYRASLWARFADPHFWWMHAMLGIWLPFAIMLFILEPFIIHKRMRTSPDAAADFRRMVRVHRILLLASLLTVVAAVGGSHGLF